MTSTAGDDQANGGGDAGVGAAGATNAGVQPPFDYALPGPQVEPTAGLWLDTGDRISVPTNQNVIAIAERTGATDRIRLDFKRDFPREEGSPAPSEKRLKAQLELLLDLQGARDDGSYPAGRDFGPTFPELGHRRFQPTPLSRFLQLQPVPFGAVFELDDRQAPLDNVLDQQCRILNDTPIVMEGQELARVFEIETPGLYHRHALNWAFFNRPDISPPRQARIWMALDMATYVALSAGWYYKWLADRHSRLLRPEEYDRRAHGEPGRLSVLFDSVVGPLGQENGADRTCPCPTPGTPRHPAWPSGHSTFSAAASHILEYFFSPDTLGAPPRNGQPARPAVSDEALFKRYPPGDDRIDEPGWIAAELRRLANNVGEARLWGGVHWLSDHLAGQRIGRAAAEAVIEQFADDCVPPVDRRSCPEAMGDVPPSDAEIRTEADRSCTPGQDTIPPRPMPEDGAPFITRFGVT